MWNTLTQNNVIKFVVLKHKKVIIFAHLINDDAQKSLVCWLSLNALMGTWRIRNQEPTESIGGMPAKDSPKVKSMNERSPRTL